MSRLRAWLLALSTLLIGVLPESTLAKDWLRADTDHFVVYSNLSQSVTRDYLRQLEAFKYLAELMLGADPQSNAAAAKFTIYLLDDRDQLKVVRPEFSQYVAGVYTHCVEGAVAFAWRPTQFGSSEGDSGLTILQHEYAHHVMFSRLKRLVPSWYVEGFAEYLSTASLERGKFIVGTNFKERSYTLMDGSPWLDFQVMLDPAKYAAAAANAKFDTFHFYAQAWLLTHYMLADTERTKAFNNYFERISHGDDPIASFTAATGIKVDKLEAVLTKYWQSLSAIQVTVPNIPESAVNVISLPNEQSDYLLESAVLQTCPATDYGKQLTEKLRAMHTQHEKDNTFHLVLDRAEILFGDPVIARDDLEQLVANNNDDFEAHYLLGRSYYDVAHKDKTTDATLMDKATHEFVVAYKLNKLHAPNMYFLAKSLSSAGGVPSKSVVNAAVGASVLAPTVPEYAYFAAYVCVLGNSPEQAIRVMQPFANDPHNPKQAVRVTNMIAAIKAGKSANEVMATLSETN